MFILVQYMFNTATFPTLDPKSHSLVIASYVRNKCIVAGITKQLAVYKCNTAKCFMTLIVILYSFGSYETGLFGPNGFEGFYLQYVG